MNKLYKRFLLPALFVLCAGTAWAQTTISGTVKDTAGPLAGVNVVVKGTVQGTITNSKGEFSLRVNQAPPLTLSFSFVGFATQEIEVKDANTSGLDVTLEEQTLLGQEVVVSASR
ncbi:MAG: carboxypeptidase-like regulatory domain-containing protein, partial [Cyclobacteriaceae bacterium]